MATYRKAQRDLFATEITPAESIPKAVRDELQTLLATLLLAVVRDRSTVSLVAEVADDQDHG